MRIQTEFFYDNTRMHSSRMRTGRSLTVCCSVLPSGGRGGSPWSRGGLPGPGGFSLVPGGLPGPGGFSLVRGGLPGPGGFSGDPPC